MAASAAAAALQQQQLLLLLLLFFCSCLLLHKPSAAADVPGSSSSSSSSSSENTPEDEEQLNRQLFSNFLGATPAIESWVGVRRFPGRGAAPVPQQQQQQEQQKQQQQQQQQEEEEDKGEDVSFFAHDFTGRNWGLLVGRVKGSSASLEDFAVHGSKNQQNIEERLLVAWLEELEGLDVSSISAVCPLEDVEAVNRFLRLGFNPVELVRMQKKEGPENLVSGQQTCIRWAVPTTFENGSSTFVLERLALVRDVLLPAARQAAVDEGFPSFVAPLEVLELKENDSLLAQKAQAFVDRSASHLDPFILDILPATTRTFIALLLAQALGRTAVQEGVESTLMVLPAVSLSAWNGAAAAGFEIQGVKAGGKLVELSYITDMAPFKSPCAHFRELKEFEYKLATLNARLSDQKPQVHALTTGEEFGAFADPALRRGRRAGMMPPTVSIFEDSALFPSAEKPKAFTEDGLRVFTGVVALYGIVLLLVLHAQKRARGKRAGSGLHAVEAWQNAVDIKPGQFKGQWEWHAAPGKEENEPSTELDDFALSLNSESTINISKPLS
ncbi:hypothetical protein Emag_002241 [Eimeria magna]